MKRILPLLVYILILISFFFIKQNFTDFLIFGNIEVRILEFVGLENRPGVISLGVLTLIALITLIKFRYSTLQLWFIYMFITSYISKILIGDLMIIIKYLSWLPIFRLSYLTAALASTIIILSLLLEDTSTVQRSNNEQET